MRSSKIKKATIYENRVKPTFDKILAFGGLVVLSPLFIAVSVAIVLDNPGPVFFTQKRIGKDGRIFKLHKFRSMRTDAPHDVPTHQLDDPEQYITNVGRVLRRTSLDELPQIWDIFRGKMSVVGPRPALWNQDDLVAEREKYNANNVLPGLTGLAQIKGRDELEIVEKAKLDGEYANVLKQGGVKALFFDVKCMIETIFSVPGGKGVVEGGTGKLHKGEEMMSNAHAADAGFDDYGHRKHFHINICEKCKRKVLITGRDSYIGTSFEKWAKEHYFLNFTIDTVDMRSEDWRKIDFALYDTVFHVAGLAHADVGKLPEEEKKKYYAVNTDLAVEAAKKAKAEGVKQFVLMSSMIIYGDSASYGKEKVIDEYTVPVPTNFYGDSKWRADKKVRALADGKFRVAVVRPPMVYGKESKRNYQTLVKLAKKLPVFPNVDNRRSMLYIDNLCEFLCKLLLSGEGGVYFPQNRENTNTSEMVKQIAEAAGKRIWLTKLLEPVVIVVSHLPGKVSGLVDKAFGNFVYCKRLSEYDGLDYQIVSFRDSIRKIEGTDAEF